MLSLIKGQYLGSTKRQYFTTGVSIIETIYVDQVFEGWHIHENPHWSFVIEGGNIEYRKMTQSDSIPGTLNFYNQGECHRNTNTVLSTRTINFEIEPWWLAQYEINEAKLMFSTANVSTKLLLLKMYKESLLCDEYSASTVQMLLLHAAQLTDNTPAKIPEWTKTVYQMLNDEWDRTFSLDELASKTGVSATNISKYFPKYFRCTLGEYMRKLKVARSLSIIKNSDTTLTEIAFDCGFSDQSHFIRTFKNVTGFLPGEYRRL
jgi:AraC family transcriptional regulator